MDKQLFDDAIGEVPRSTIDVDAVITRGRRADRIRRMANPVVAAGVAVVLLTGVVAYTLTRDDGGTPQVGGQPTTSTESPTTSPPVSTTSTSEKLGGLELPEACSRPDLESAGEVVARITPVVKGAFQAQRPDVQLGTSVMGNHPEGVQHGPLEFFQTEAGQPICDKVSYFQAAASTQAPEGAGNILVAVQPAFSGGASMTCDEDSTERTYCEQVTGPNGEDILKETRLVGGSTQHWVGVVRQDGTSVSAYAENSGTSAKSGDAPTATAPPLSHDQLVAIATDAGLTLFP